VPGELDGFGDARELDGLISLAVLASLEDFVLCCFERVRVLGAELDEQGSALGSRVFNRRAFPQRPDRLQ